MGNSRADVKIGVHTDIDRLNALGLKGNSYKEINDNLEDSLTYHGVCEDVVNGRTGEVREYDFLGKKFSMANGSIAELVLLKDRDQRYEELAECETVQDFYLAALKWEFENELAGREPSEDMWPEMLDWMRNAIYLEWEEGGPARGKHTEEQIKKEKDHIASLDDESVMSLWGSQAFYALKNIILYA